MKNNLRSFFTQLFQTQKRSGATSFQDLGMTSCCLLPLTIAITTPEILTNGGVITTIVTTGLIIGLGLGITALSWRVISQVTTILNEQASNSTQQNIEVLEQLLSKNSSLFSTTEGRCYRFVN